MNMLLLKRSDIINGKAVVNGPRALHIHSVLRSKPGDRIKTGILDGKIGSMRLVSITKNTAELDDPVLELEPPEKLPLTLCVALPRPQSFKKTLHFIASAGVQRAVFFHSSRVEKSYWNSGVMEPDAIHAEMEEGLEQGVDTILPELIFFRSFKEFLNNADSLFDSDTLKIVAHPVPDNPELKEMPHTALAIGPEGGFIPSEVESLEKAGFLKCGFGRHILRVEFACAFIAGKLM